jgi:hypothetical protein
MANHCSNYITLGDHFDDDKYQEFIRLMEKLQENGEDYEPAGKDDRWICEITIDCGIINAISRWDSCIKAMIELADKYEFCFNLEYEEGGNCLFGEYEYNPEIQHLAKRFITEDEWVTDGGATDSWYEDMEKLLENKNFEAVEV